MQQKGSLVCTYKQQPLWNHKPVLDPVIESVNPYNADCWWLVYVLFFASGVRGLWTGCGPTICRAMILTATQVRFVFRSGGTGGVMEITTMQILLLLTRHNPYCIVWAADMLYHLCLDSVRSLEIFLKLWNAKYFVGFVYYIRCSNVNYRCIICVTCLWAKASMVLLCQNFIYCYSCNLCIR